MAFYTNVRAVGNQIFLRGVDDIGERFSKKVRYSPTLFTSSNESTKYTTVDGKCVAPISFEGLREARNFIEKYKDVDGFEIYGFDKFDNTFIGDEYPEEIEYDFQKLVIANIDVML